MAKILDKINKIRTAIFGKEVRSALADGLETVNEEIENTTKKQEYLEKTFNNLIINSGESNAEIVDARTDKTTNQSYPKLGDRIDEVSSQLLKNKNDLTNKINDLDGTKANINKVRISTDIEPINVTEFDTETKKLFTGGSVAVVGENSVGTENLKKQAVKSNNIDLDIIKKIYSIDSINKLKLDSLFSEEPKNLFNKKSVKNGVFLINGIEKPSPNNAISDYIKVNPGDVLYVSRILSTDGGALYDANLNFIGKLTRDEVENENKLTISEGVYYIRVNISSIASVKDTFMIVKGSKPKGYIEHFSGEIEGLNIQAEKIQGKISLEQIKDFEFKNLFDKNNIIKNRYIKNNGDIADSSTINISDYIRVTPGETIGTNFKYEFQGAFYTDNKNWFSSIQLEEKEDGWFTCTVPEGVYFMRFNVTTYRLNQVMIKKTPDKPTSYSPFGGSFKINDNLKLKDKKILCIGDSITWLDGHTSNSFENGNTILVGYQEQLRIQGATVTSMGHSGATIRKYLSTDDIEHGSLVDDIKNNNYDVTGYDIITIFAGTNDVGRGLKLGVIGDENDNDFDENTTLGALRSIIEYIRNNNPTSTIYIITPIKSGLTSRPFNKMKQLSEAVKEVSNLYGIKNIDLFNKSGIGKGNYNTFLYDLLHPNNIGFEKIGLEIINAMS